MKISEFRDLLANDGFAATFQTMGQYRTELLRALDKLRAQADARPFGYKSFDDWCEEIIADGGHTVRSWIEGQDSMQAAREAWEVGRYQLTHPEASAPGLSDEDTLSVAAALESARVFIKNGVEFGYIRMPDADCPDPAHGTLPLIEHAMRILTRASAATVAEPSWTTDHPENTGVGDYCQPGDGRKPRWILLFDDADRSMGVYESEQEARTAFARAEGAGWNCWLFSPTLRAAQQQAEQKEERGIPMEVLRVTYAPDMSPEEFARMWPKFKAWQQAEHVGQECGDSAGHVGIQQAEPGADERAAFEAAYRNGCAEVTMRRNRDGRYEHNVQNTAWKIWQAARAAQSGQRAGVAEGWQLVPVEPTEEMLRAADEGDREYSVRNFGDGVIVRQGPYDHWVAMLAAAPTQQQEGGDV